MRWCVVAVAVIGSLAWSACAGGTSSPTQTTAPPTPPPPAAGTRTQATTPSAPTPTPVPATAIPPGATSTPVPSGDSGINGRVTIGPTCPVQRIDSPCPDRPYEVTIAVLDSGRRGVAETRSDSSGHFRLLLPPGSYTLSPPRTGVPPTAPEQTVDVVAGRFTDVQIVFDSGIR